MRAVSKTVAELPIDLEQLAIRESEQVEWKENVADIDDVVETLAAFANDLPNLGGGYVICGAEERRDEHGFPVLVRSGLTSARLKEVEGKVLTRCREKVDPAITPLVAEVPADTPDRRILVFLQPSTGAAHTARRADGGAKHFVRVGRSTVEARNGVLRTLLVRKGALEPWDRRACSSATINDLDLLALRDALQRMRVFSADVGLEPYLSEEIQLSAFVPSLCVRDALTGVLRPRNYAILLFGREIQRFIPGAYSLFSIYPGADRSAPHAERHELSGTLIDQARRLESLLDLQAYTTFDKTNPSAPNSVKYPKRALYEAMGNALAHRDYEEAAPTRVTVFDDRIEVLSSGPLPVGVDPIAFSEGRASPRWRNQALAWFFNKLQIAQGEGQGIPTILRSMREEGCPPPTLQPDDIQVLCTLPAHPRHGMLRELKEIEQSIVLGQLTKAQQLAIAAIRREPLNHRVLQLFGEIQTALQQPGPVNELLKGIEINSGTLPSSVLLQLSDALCSNEAERDRYRSLSTKLLAAAAQGRLEEKELRSLGVALLRNREETTILSLIERNLADHPEWHDNASIAQLKGDAFIGLAKKCRNTAKRVRMPAQSRDRAWRQFSDYLNEAEKELHRAESLSIDPVLTSIIRKNLTYLTGLKRENLHRRR